jgi:S1-C subfamily serine protease
MTQEEKIKAYLLGQLSEAESSAFKAEILADAELTRTVKRAKIAIIEDEMAIRARLRANMTEWKTQIPDPDVSPPKRWFRIGTMVIISLLLGLIGWQIWEYYTDGENHKNQIASTQKLEDGSIKTPVPIIEALPKDGTSDVNVRTTADKMEGKLWHTALLEIKVARYQAAVALKGTSSTGSVKQWTPQKRTSPYFGIVIEKEQKNYVLAPAGAIALAASEVGSITGKDAAGKTYPLRLLGKDELYGLAVLTFENDAIAWLNRTLSIAVKSGSTQQADFFTGKLLARSTIRQQNGEYFLANTSNKDARREGALIDEQERIIGWMAPLARTAFNLQSSDIRNIAALSAPALDRVVDQLIENPVIRRPYFGVAFEQVEDKVKIAAVLSGSPASPHVDNLLGCRVDSLNGMRVENLLDISEILSKVKPKEYIFLSGLTEQGVPLKQKLYAKIMDDRAVGTIGEGILNNMDGFSMLNDLSALKVEYRGALFLKGIYYITAACPGRNECTDNVMNIRDLGIQMQAIALQKEGVLRIYNEQDKQGNNPLYYPITFPNARLWH